MACLFFSAAGRIRCLTQEELARQYGALNDLNRVTVHSADDWIGIAACGHTYHELREALRALGFATDNPFWAFDKALIATERAFSRNPFVFGLLAVTLPYLYVKRRRPLIAKLNAILAVFLGCFIFLRAFSAIKTAMRRCSRFG